MAEPADMSAPPLRMLAVDVGGGTQDVLVYDSSMPVENCVRMVLPAQTQVVAERIRRATRAGRPVCLTGYLMGGGASGDAVEEHLSAGLAAYATPAAAMTLDNNLEKVRALGVQILDNGPPGVERIRCGDLDLNALHATLASFAIEPPPPGFNMEEARIKQNRISNPVSYAGPADPASLAIPEGSHRPISGAGEFDWRNHRTAELAKTAKPHAPAAKPAAVAKPAEPASPAEGAAKPADTPAKPAEAAVKPADPTQAPAEGGGA